MNLLEARDATVGFQRVEYSRTQVREYIWYLDAVKSSKSGITKVGQCFEQAIAKGLIELSPALLRGVHRS